MYKYIQTHKEEYKLYVTLNRPSKRNAFTPTMVNELNHAFQLANEEEEIKIVIIRAEGPIFCAGMDLKTFEDPNLDEVNETIPNQNISLGQVFDKLNKPSVALVEGDVIAGGFLIILGCTYVFCKESVRFRLPELEIGLFPFQVMASLLKVMSEKSVLQLCLQTDYFSAEKAKAYGIVDAYLERINITQFLDTFKNKSSHAMYKGIQALRHLKSVPPEQHYVYLKKILDQLKIER